MTKRYTKAIIPSPQWRVEYIPSKIQQKHGEGQLVALLIGNPHWLKDAQVVDSQHNKMSANEVQGHIYLQNITVPGELSITLFFGKAVRLII